VCVAHDIIFDNLPCYSFISGSENKSSYRVSKMTIPTRKATARLKTPSKVRTDNTVSCYLRSNVATFGRCDSCLSFVPIFMRRRIKIPADSLMKPATSSDALALSLCSQQTEAVRLALVSFHQSRIESLLSQMVLRR